MNLIERTLTHLQERRNKILNGGINCIPSPFTRFSEEFVGIEQGNYYCVTGSTKSGKTQFTSYTFLYNPLLYAYNNPNKIRIKIFYYSLEETPEDITRRFMSYLLYVHTKGTVKVSPTNLQSTNNSNPVSQEVLDILKQEEISNILKFFEDHVYFSPSRNATGVYNEVKKYMEEHGTVHRKPQKIKNDFGDTIEIQAFDWYEPNDPDEYVIVIFDHLSLIQSERNMTLKQNADKLSEYFVVLRNRYKVTPVLIQQQAFANESLDAFKQGKLRPTAQGLADSKYSARDCNVLLGLFNPFKHELPEYKGYDITKLKDHCRFLEVILNRGGSSGGLIGLIFEGAVCYWKELPPPSANIELTAIYNYYSNTVRTAKSFFTITLKNLFRKKNI